MNKKNRELSTSLVETISKSELANLGADIIEVGIDELLEDDNLLKHLPVIGVIFGIRKTGIAIRDYRFTTKLLHFLNESKKLTKEQREKIIDKLEDDKYQLEAGEKLISIIDNLETKSKAKLIGKALCLFGNDVISSEEFWKISFIVEKLPISDINALKNWKETDLNKVENMRRQLYMSVGLVWFKIDFSSDGFVWTERFCEIISEHLI